eukprot:8055206-Pyramimonas_sp.AAC.1
MTFKRRSSPAADSTRCVRRRVAPPSVRSVAWILSIPSSGEASWDACRTTNKCSKNLVWSPRIVLRQLLAGTVSF